MVVRPYIEADREAVVALWRASGLTVPWNDPYRDIDRKMAIDPKGFLVAEDEGKVVGTVMAGYEGHRGWINYLGVEPGRQRAGIGRALMAAATELLRARGCPKINLQVRKSNTEVIAFYEALGFTEEPVLSMAFRLVNDE